MIGTIVVVIFGIMPASLMSVMQAAAVPMLTTPVATAGLTATIRRWRKLSPTRQTRGHTLPATPRNSRKKHGKWRRRMAGAAAVQAPRQGKGDAAKKKQGMPPAKDKRRQLRPGLTQSHDQDRPTDRDREVCRR